ncbi:MAG: hypothetical protein RLZZ15_1652 [Verrucomicrobiota bacterium]
MWSRARRSGGGTGRHAGLRSLCLKAWGFESPPEHHGSRSRDTPAGSPQFGSRVGRGVCRTFFRRARLFPKAIARPSARSAGRGARHHTTPRGFVLTVLRDCVARRGGGVGGVVRTAGLRRALAGCQGEGVPRGSLHRARRVGARGGCDAGEARGHAPTLRGARRGGEAAKGNAPVTVRVALRRVAHARRPAVKPPRRHVIASSCQPPAQKRSVSCVAQVCAAARGAASPRWRLYWSLSWTCGVKRHAGAKSTRHRSRPHVWLTPRSGTWP